jgi:hypothetical protein
MHIYISWIERDTQEADDQQREARPDVSQSTASIIIAKKIKTR